MSSSGSKDFPPESLFLNLAYKSMRWSITMALISRQNN
ncbi:unnamed protein product [Chondrus crispus]|uniref:Uncharacterized protein n=1 Tax=Chondrus crispus TaxID=2769 RepID=R7QNI7_CHOCR|nr:unnamed protein product [Chondrus crispus]CDF39021.1 unnamed protein product [Chondrus crispus]|eukprot:XP_005718926.1 unnamed protein product [Chondrus crispus]